LTRVRAELEAATRHRTGLKVMLTMRERKIEALTFEIERLRRQNQNLDTPPADAVATAK
jgi:hypothetical protein